MSTYNVKILNSFNPELQLRGDLRSKLCPCFIAGFFNIMKKEPCTDFCGVLIRFHEVIKLQSSEFSVSDAIHANVQNMLSLVYFAFFVSFLEKKPINFYSAFDHFYKLMKC